MGLMCFSLFVMQERALHTNIFLNEASYTNKMLDKEYQEPRLNSFLRKCYGQYNDIVKYNDSLSRMPSDARSISYTG